MYVPGDGHSCFNSFNLAGLKQGLRDGSPFFRQRCVGQWGRAAGPGIPITGIGDVAFLPVQVGVNPVTLAASRSLAQFMCPRPIACSIMPERLEGQAQVVDGR